MIDREAHQRQNCKRIDLSRDATTKQTLTHTLSLAAKIKKTRMEKKFCHSIQIDRECAG